MRNKENIRGNEWFASYGHNRPICAKMNAQESNENCSDAAPQEDEHFCGAAIFPRKIQNTIDNYFQVWYIVLGFR